MKNKSIVFTGGGTAGHVLPNFPLIDRFLSEGWTVSYVGSKDGIEKELIEKNFPQIKYYGVTCDKLRRYMTWRHFAMPFKLTYGFFETFFLLKKINPDVIFSKGGFVSVPVVLCGKLLKKKIIVHESDYSVGLANKISFPFVDLIAVSFDVSLYDSKYHKKMIQVGPLIRKSFLEKKNIFDINFSDNQKKTLLVMGGSLGAKNINNTIYNNINNLVEQFNVIHICGKNNLPNFDVEKYRGQYYIFEYLNEGISYLMSISDLIVSRAGVNSIWEILLMKKPAILIPLSAKNSRGDQIHNAKYFEKMNVVDVISDDELNFNILNEKIGLVLANSEKYSNAIEKMNLGLGDERLFEEIMKIAI